MKGERKKKRRMKEGNCRIQPANEQEKRQEEKEGKDVKKRGDKRGKTTISGRLTCGRSRNT